MSRFRLRNTKDFDDTVAAKELSVLFTDDIFCNRHQRSLEERERSQRAMFLWQNIQLHADLEQDLCIEMQLRDADHRRDRGPDRGENGSSEEAAARCTSKQTTYVTKSTQSMQHPREVDLDLSLELEGGTGTADPTEQAAMNTEERKESQNEEHWKLESTCPNQQTWTPWSSKSKRHGRTGEAKSRQHRGNTQCHFVYDEQ